MTDPMYYHHLMGLPTGNCVYCGTTQHQVATGQVSAFCRGPAGFWPIPESTSNEAQSSMTIPQETPHIIGIDPEEIDQDAYREFMRGL